MKKIIFFITLSLIITFHPVYIIADIYPAVPGKKIQYVQPYSNQTGYRYKISNGKVWKRLWSYTYHRWEEPDWSLA